MKRLLLLLVALVFISFSSKLFSQNKKVVANDGFVYFEINTPKGKVIKNEMGDIIVPPGDYSLGLYDNGCFSVSKVFGNNGNLYEYVGLYNKNGQYIIPISRQYDDVDADVKEGFLCIRFRKGKLKVKYAYNGVCDANGKELISPDRGYDNILFSVSQGIPYFIVYKGKKQGICNAEGKEIIPPLYKKLFYTDWRETKTFASQNKNLGISVTDQAFNFDQNIISFGKKVDFLINLDQNVHREDDSFVWYEIKPGYGAKDQFENIIVPENYKVHKYEKGYFVVNDNSLMAGVYDKTGKCIIPTNRNYFLILNAELTKEDLIAFKCLRKVGKKEFVVGVCDANGKELISPDRGYDNIYFNVDKGIPYFIVYKGKKEGICNASGKEILYPQYNSVLVHPYDGKIDTDGKNSGLSLTQAAFNYDKKSISFGEDRIQRENYLTRSDITKELCIESVVGFKYYRFSKDGKCGALSTEGKLIVPPDYKFITFDDFSDALLAIKADGSQAMYTKSGQELIPVSRGYTFIMRWDEDGYGPYYQVEMGKGNIGLCDAGGTEIIPPTRGYTDISLSNYKSTWFTIVQKDGKYGVCTASGREIVQPIYDDLAIREDKGTFVGKTSSGNTIDLKIKPNGYKVQEFNYQAEEERKARRKANRRRWLTAFAVGLAGVANAYANVVAQQAARPNVPTYTPSMPATSYSGPSNYLTSPTYLAQVQARADRSMANYQARLHQIGQQALANNQQMMNRSKNMFSEMTNWVFRFKSQNGREPTDLEKSQWVKQNYPDMFASYVQAQASQYERSSSNDESTESKKEISNTYDCSYCGGTGRLLQEDETLSFGLSAEKDYKCQECGKWKYKGKTHRHYDCTHCKGSGKVTLR